MNLRRFVPACLAAGLLVCLTAAPLWASEEGGGDPVFSNVGLGFRILNFLIVAAGIWYLFGKILPKSFHARIREISGAINEAAQSKVEAEKKLREAEKKLGKLDLELGVMQESAQRDALAEAERIRAAAREEAAKVERAAELEIVAAERAARIELQAVAARLAVQRAEEVLRGQMTPATDASLFRAFVSDLGRSAN